MFAFAQKNDDRALYESLSEMDVTDDIKDEFLDDPEVMVIGAENDPKIAALIDKIPEDDDADEPTEKDLDKIEEAMFDYESDDNIKDRITSEDEDFSEFDDPTAGKVTEDYESESDSAIEDEITSEDEDFSEFDI